MNKADLVGGETAAIEKDLRTRGIEVFLSISAATRGSVDVLIQKLLPIVLEERENRQALRSSEQEQERATLPILRPHLESEKMNAFRIEKKGEAFVVSGKRLEQFTKMTDFKNSGGVLRFKDVIERVSLKKALTREGWVEGMPVKIGGVSVEEHL